MDEDKRHLNSAENGPKLEKEEQDTDDMVATNFDGDQPRLEDIQSKRDEEYAEEMTADDEPVVDSDEDGTEANSAFGWIALALSIISYFMAPIILGGAGIIMGFVSRNRDAETLGNTAIIAGAISILITLFVLPFV